MKKLILIISTICLMTSCSPKVIELANGEKISQKELNRIVKKACKKALKEMSKEQKDLLFGVSRIEVDTINVESSK